jgi:N-carbamoyl-L-amino-acid hydrolase
MNIVRLVPNVERLRSDIEMLSTFVDQSKPGWTRRPFTPWYRDGREWLRERMEEAGMEVEIDAASNLIGRLQGSHPNLPSIMIGSHTDTVTGGGRFDGIIGVLAGVEIARMLKNAGILLKHTLEVVDFTAEEPSEFGISTIGSRGMVNNLPAEMLQRTDSTGLVLSEAIAQAGGTPANISARSRKKGDVAIYLELHIEQGPVLEETSNKLGVVTGIVGIVRYRVTITGQPNHAGTTPMSMRFDALTAASEAVLLIETVCRESYGEAAVGTVGKYTVEPNASNVIPGRVVFDYEVRCLDIAIMEEITERIHNQAGEIMKKRGLTVTFDCLSKSEPIHVHTDVQEIIKEACETTGKTLSLPSGAGHDGNQLARIAPIGMIFVPSKDGRSHCPEELTEYDDVALGVEALVLALIRFDEKLMRQR